MEKPKLLIIAGPNGSGKTTFTRLLLGHYWSEDCLFIKNIKRYFSSMQMCVYGATLADRVYVNDNSVEGSSPVLLFRTCDGKLYKKYSNLGKHDWVKEILKQFRGFGV